MDTLLKLDREIVLWLNQWAGRSGFLDGLEKLVVSDYFVPVSVSLCLLALWFVGRDPRTRDSNQRAVITALIAVGLANLLVLALNHYLFRPRPFVEYELTMLFYEPTDSSFPSNPAVVAFAMACGVWSGNRRVGACLFAMASLWGLSRVYAGLFYPSDIAAGALIGMSTAYMVAIGMRLIEPVPTLVLRATRSMHLA